MIWKTISKAIAHLVVHRRAAMALLLLAITAISWKVVAVYNSFDTDVFNMLPEGFESVKGLKAYNTDFAQSRQISFGVFGKEDADDFDQFVETFSKELEKEKWVRRVLHGSPMDSPETVKDLYQVFVPLLLSLDPAEFAKRMEALKPDVIANRLTRLKAELEAGSPKAEVEATMDPLGIVFPTIRPIVDATSTLNRPKDPAQRKAFELFLVITHQKDLGEPSCAELMTSVRAFRDRMLSEWKGTPVEVEITGRAADVAEISASMKWDITVTSTVSLLLVGILFYLGFRQVLSLIGIIVLLAVSCLVGLAFGAVLFAHLSVIAIAFCSILIGLGDDFSLLLIERYRRAVEEERASHFQGVFLAIHDAAPGILYVSGITAISFLSLWFSRSGGFAQLGVMIAAGVVSCAVLMVLFLFVFVRGHEVKKPEENRGLFHKYVLLAGRNPKAILIGSGLVFGAAVLISFGSWIPLRFDTDARSMEPKTSPASKALARITSTMKVDIDPVVIVVEGKDLQETQAAWKKLSKGLNEQIAAGKLKSFSDPTPFLSSPSATVANQAMLRQTDLMASKAAFLKSLTEQGFDPAEFTTAIDLFDRLAEAGKQEGSSAQWRPEFRDASPLHFLMDRFLANRSFIAAGFVQPTKPMASPADQQELGALIRSIGVPVQLTGWKYALMDLVPWAQSELKLFGSIVVVMVVILLGWFYRRLDLWLIHVGSLALAFAGLIATLKLLGQTVNLLNVLAFPLVIAVGVDYGLHVLSMSKETKDWPHLLDWALKPIVMSGFTTVSGFGSLCLATNPALSGMGTICSLGILWCILTVCFFVTPCMFVFVLHNQRKAEQEYQKRKTE